MNRETEQNTPRNSEKNIRNPLKNLYSIKLESLKEINSFLDMSKPSQFNQEEISDFKTHSK